MHFLHAVRTFGMRQDLASFRRLHSLLITDRDFRAFHAGRTSALPEFYHHVYERKLGKYAALLSRADRTPELVVPAARRLPNEPPTHLQGAHSAEA